MTNVAVIISASSYSGELGELPAGAKDSDAMSKIVKHQDRFDEVMVIHDEPDATVINEKLFGFIKRFENSDVGEFLFYFSGHGEFYEDEFYYLMRDYRTLKRRQTSIINSELDNAVRAIQPRLYAKIVDACHSGISYIKDANYIDGYLQKSKPAFKELYFLFSSQSDQASWQGKNLSYFTSSIVGSVIDHKSPTLKYKDVIHYVSDEFENIKAQKPFFVNQGSFSDVFCDVTDDLKAALRSTYMPGNLIAEGSHPKSPSLFSLVQEEAETYCDKETALSIVSDLEGRFSSIKLDPEFSGLFTISVNKEDRRNLPEPDDIGIWISRKNDRGYFAQPMSLPERFEKKVLKSNYLSTIGISIAQLTGAGSDENFKTVFETRQVIRGYKNTTDLPFEALFIKAENLLPNISEVGCYIAPIICRTHVRVFYTFTQWDAEDWTSRKRVGAIEWQSVEAALKDEQSIVAMVDQIGATFVAYVQNPIKARFNID